MKCSHAPHDEVYGSLLIPSYCWSIIDTIEFQRLKFLYQLGSAHYVFPGATHSRFEHSLGTTHLTYLFLDNLEKKQSELQIKDEHRQAIIIASLCHDLGYGPWGKPFERFVKENFPNSSRKERSCQILKYMYEKYQKIRDKVDYEVIEAACQFIMGKEMNGFYIDPYTHEKKEAKYPRWLSFIISNKDTYIDLNKLDYLIRDTNRTLYHVKFQFERLIYNCKILDNRLCWKESDIHSIERVFYAKIDMENRVYQHRVTQSINCMIYDILNEMDEKINFGNVLNDPVEFVKLDDRLFSLVLRGKYGETAQEIALRIQNRNLYKCIGEVLFQPNRPTFSLSQLPPNKFKEDISNYIGTDEIRENIRNSLRIVKNTKKHAFSRDGKHPLELIPFWRQNLSHSYNLCSADISSITPVQFREILMRVFVTDKLQEKEAHKAFVKWKQQNFS